MAEMDFGDLKVKKNIKVDVGLSDERTGNANQGSFQLPPSVAKLAKEGIKPHAATKVTVKGTTEVDGDFMKSVGIVYADKRELNTNKNEDREPVPAEKNGESPISPCGGVIQINGCKVKFADGTFERVSRVKVSVVEGNTELPDGYVAATPTLNLESESPLLVPATVQLPTWFVINDDQEDERVMVDVFHLDDSTRTCENIGTLTLKNERIIECKVQNFSPIWAALSRMFLPRTAVIASVALYERQNAEFHGVFCLDDISVNAAVEKKMDKLGTKLRLQLTPIAVTSADRFRMALLCQQETGFIFNPVEGHAFETTTDLLRLTMSIRTFVLTDPNLTHSSQKLQLLCNIEKQDKDDTVTVLSSQPFVHKWVQDVATAGSLQSPSDAESHDGQERPTSSYCETQSPGKVDLSHATVKNLHIGGEGNIHDNRSLK